MTRFRRNTLSGAGIAVLAMLLLQPLVAYPAPSPITPTLAESPLNSQNPVKPNVMFTMDDSGSMANYYLPDYVGETSGMCRDGSACGKATNTSFPTQMDPPIASFQFNHLYYNPGETYSVGQREDRADLIYDKSGGAWTQVLTDPFNKYPAASTSAATNLAPTSGTPTKALSTATDRYPDTIWCMKSTNSSADWATADTDGSVCRRNGRKYLAGGSGANKTLAIEAGYNYPNSSNPPPGSCPSNTKCQFTNGYMVYGYPYYYNISSVQFCSGKDANGWGASGCVAKWDSSATPPHKYVSYGGGFNATAFTRVDITPSGFVRNGAPPVAINSDNGRTYAQEMANFATWYAFSRTRLNALKTAGGIGFAALELDPAHIHTRIGFNTLNSYQSKWLPIQEFNPLNRSSWFNNFYSVQPSSTTPSVDAMWRVGEYFSNRGTTAGLTSTQAADPLDKDTGKCQPNFHLLSTDGYWNQTVGSYTGLAGSIGNSDATPVPTLPVANTGTGFTPGQPFPLPYHEGSGTNSMSNGMADVAMYYWIHDLRPLLADKGKDSIAPWQHVTFYGLSIGAEGTIPYAPNPPAGVVWPKPASLTPAAIDDLWHAAVNSRGKYFDAQTSRELGESIVNSLSDFTDQEGTGTGVGLAGAQLSVTNQYAYMTRYQIGIWGDVKKYKLDIDTGILPVDADGHPLNAAIWSAATQLDAQAAVIGSVNGWDTNRKIITRNDVSKAVVPFRLDSLSATQQSSLNAGWYGVLPQPTSQSVLNFLRGDQSLEGVDTTSFRTRSHILGDVVYSGAVPVGPPNLPYIDASNPGYEKFVNDNASRAAAVYVGANDGMVHAFDDTATNGGKETWAYIPMALFSGGDPNDSAHAPSAAFQIGSLTYRRGGIPLFAHKFFVNATPRAWDVDFGNTNVSNASGPPSSGNDWRTVLIGGLGAGGRAVYALDVTNPVALSDTEASIVKSGRALWEFTAPDLGYVFDQPTLVKTYAYGWVVLVASGYNNPGGKGYLYVLNPRNGVELQKLELKGDSGTDTSPTGLSTIRAYVLSRKDPYVLQAYGGDLKGNVWRFDLSNPDASKWGKGELIAHLENKGKPQPITTGVRVEIDQNNNVDRYLFVGTGKLLDQLDLSDASVINSVYVIKDGTRTTPEPVPATPYSRTNLNEVNGANIAGFTTTPTGRGWYQDAPRPDAKIVTDVYADVQIVVYAFSYPSSDPCEAILAATLYARDLTTGNSVLESSAGGTGGSVVASVDILGGIAGVTLVQAVASAADMAPPLQVQVTTLTGQVYSFGARLSSAAGSRHRVSWRLMN